MSYDAKAAQYIEGLAIQHQQQGSSRGDHPSSPKEIPPEVEAAKLENVQTEAKEIIALGKNINETYAQMQREYPKSKFSIITNEAEPLMKQYRSKMQELQAETDQVKRLEHIATIKEKQEGILQIFSENRQKLEILKAKLEENFCAKGFGLIGTTSQQRREITESLKASSYRDSSMITTMASRMDSQHTFFTSVNTERLLSHDQQLRRDQWHKDGIAAIREYLAKPDTDAFQKNLQRIYNSAEKTRETVEKKQRS
jgi:hypothetical protein